jgi:hypothetical protein
MADSIRRIMGMFVLLAHTKEKMHCSGSCLIKRRPGYALTSLRMSASREMSATIALMSSSSLNIFCSHDLSSGND